MASREIVFLSLLFSYIMSKYWRMGGIRGLLCFAACAIVVVKGTPEDVAFGFGIRGRPKKRNPLIIDTVSGANRIFLTNIRSASPRPLSMNYRCISIKLSVIGVGMAPEMQ